jgi:hypothetical protein
VIEIFYRQREYRNHSVGKRDRLPQSRKWAFFMGSEGNFRMFAGIFTDIS